MARYQREKKEGEKVERKRGWPPRGLKTAAAAEVHPRNRKGEEKFIGQRRSAIVPPPPGVLFCCVFFPLEQKGRERGEGGGFGREKEER